MKGDNSGRIKSHHVTNNNHFGYNCIIIIDMRPQV